MVRNERCAVGNHKKDSGRYNPWKYSTTKHPSILSECPDCKLLDDAELWALYEFYVLHSPCEKTSCQGRPFERYGWSGSIRDTGLGSELEAAFTECKGQMIVPRGPVSIPRGDKLAVDLPRMFQLADFTDGPLLDVATERVAMRATSGSNSWLRLFRRIRNCLAHGRFEAADPADGLGPSLIMEDRDANNITARIVLRLQTLLKWREIVGRGPTIAVSPAEVSWSE